MVCSFEVLNSLTPKDISKLKFHAKRFYMFRSINFKDFVKRLTLIKFSRSPAIIYLFKGNNGNTAKRCEICPMLMVKTREQCH